MHLDHVSYVSSHDQVADVVQRIGSQIGTAFVDGGIHPRFGTRNFTAPLLNGQYIEVVCPLDHPAAEQTPFGKAVTKKANEGGGWLTWVIATSDITKVEAKFGRMAVEGHRRRPDGSELKWKQIGIIEMMENSQSPFYIQWQTSQHPSEDGHPLSSLLKINLECKNIGDLENEIFSFEGINKSQISLHINDDKHEIGISSVDFLTPSGVITIQ